MATQVTNYQCPSCTGPLRYDGTNGKLVCDYCGSSFTISQIEAMYAGKEEQAEAAAATAKESSWAEDSHLKAVLCPSCGAELLCDSTTAATSCPYCGNPSVVPGTLSGALKPDFVIPFKYSKEDAISALKAHYKGKPLLPKEFAGANHVEEIKGVYVPFWLFDSIADADVSFEATRVHRMRTRDEEITRTEHFQVRRAGTVVFEKIPVAASTKMPESHMDAIEPYDYSELKAFSTAYLPGFLADKYDVQNTVCYNHAGERCKNSAISAMRNAVSGYDTCNVTGARVNLTRTGTGYALLPVWLLHTKWNGENYLFAMNGQTGKLVGDLPVSMGKFWAFFAGIFASLAALLSLIILV